MTRGDRSRGPTPDRQIFLSDCLISQRLYLTPAKPTGHGESREAVAQFPRAGQGREADLEPRDRSAVSLLDGGTRQPHDGGRSQKKYAQRLAARKRKRLAAPELDRDLHAPT